MTQHVRDTMLLGWPKFSEAAMYCPEQVTHWKVIYTLKNKHSCDKQRVLNLCIITFKYLDINHSTIQPSRPQSPWWVFGPRASWFSLVDAHPTCAWCVWCALRPWPVTMFQGIWVSWPGAYVGNVCKQPMGIKYKVMKIAMSCMNQHRYKPWTSDNPWF